VGNGREEFVLGAAGGLRFAIQTSVLERDGGTRGQLLRQRQIRRAVSIRSPRAERQQSERLATRDQRNQQQRFTRDRANQPLILRLRP
jgi:hypothetical protein